MRKFALALMLLCTGLVAVALLVLRDDKVLAQHDSHLNPARTPANTERETGDPVQRVAQAYFDAALANEPDAARFAVSGTPPASVAGLKELREGLAVKSVRITHAVIVEKGKALAYSTPVNLKTPNPDGQDSGRLIVTLAASGENWLVKDIDLEKPSHEQDVQDSAAGDGDASNAAIPKPWDGLQGIIMDVDENKHAAISIGADDGVAVDDLFRLVRGRNLVGWLKVIELAGPDKAIIELDGLDTQRDETVVRVGRLVRGSSFPGGKTIYNDLGEGRFEAVDVPRNTADAANVFGGGPGYLTGCSRPATEIDILPLKHGSAADVATTINQLFRSDGVTCGFDGQSNSLIVRGSKANLQKVKELVERLDEHATAITEQRRAAEGHSPARATQVLSDESVSMMMGLGGRRSSLDPDEIATLRKAFSGADQRTQELAAQLRTAVKNANPDRDTVKLLQRRLHEAVTAAFDARQQLQRAEAEVLRSRLQDVGRKLERRETLRDEIINKRVLELIDPELRWEPSPPPTPAVNSLTGTPIGLSRPPQMARNSFSSLDELDSALQMEKSLIGVTALVFFTSTDSQIAETALADYYTLVSGRGVPAFKVDVDKYPDIASRYNVKSVPTVVMLVGGKERKRVTGTEFQPLVDELQEIHLELEGLDALPGENFRSVLIQALAVELQRRDEMRSLILELELAAAELSVPITVPARADAEMKLRLEREESERRNKLVQLQDRIAAFQEELKPIDARIKLLRDRLAEMETADETAPPGAVPTAAAPSVPVETTPHALRLRQASDYATAFRRLQEHIAADQAILKVDPPPENVGIGNVQKHLESSRNELAILMQEYEAQVRLLELDLAEAQVAFSAAEEHFQQLQQLYKTGVVPVTEMGQARSAAETTKFRVERAQTLLDLYRKSGPPAVE